MPLPSQPLRDAAERFVRCLARVAPSAAAMFMSRAGGFLMRRFVWCSSALVASLVQATIPPFARHSRAAHRRPSGETLQKRLPLRFRAQSCWRLAPSHAPHPDGFGLRCPLLVWHPAVDDFVTWNCNFVRACQSAKEMSARPNGCVTRRVLPAKTFEGGLRGRCEYPGFHDIVKPIETRRGR